MLAVPTTGRSYDIERPPELINHNRGLLSCGGVESGGTQLNTCKFWKHGQAGWEDRPDLKEDHDVGK